MGLKNNRPPISSPHYNTGCLLNIMYFEISDKPENTDMCKRMIVHEFVLLNIYCNVTCGNMFAACLSL